MKVGMLLTINPIQTGLFESKIVRGEGSICPPPPPLPRVSWTKNQFPLNLCRILNQCVTKIFLPKYLMATSKFGWRHKIFREMYVIFRGFFINFFVFCLRFCLQADFFSRSVNIGYYLKCWSNEAPNRLNYANFGKI